MAELYRARLGERDVALKRPLGVYNDDEQFIVMLTDEARITALFDHPNVARTYEFGVVDGQYFLAMEYIDGVDLRALLKRAGDRRERVAPTTAVWIVEAALRGLHHAHEARDGEGRPVGLIHRDFSPSNLVVAYDGRVKLIDFGIAKARLNRSRTRAGFIKGKVRYMSPEQTRSEALDRRSDVFSAGVVLYFTVTGRLPFAGVDDSAVMEAVRGVDPVAPSAVVEGLDAGLDAVVARALAKDREGRFETAADFADALEAWRVAQGAGAGDVAAAALVGRMFARERAEGDALYGSFAAGAGGEQTGEQTAGERSGYTRLVGGGPEPDGLTAELDAWLEARRRGDVWVGQEEAGGLAGGLADCAESAGCASPGGLEDGGPVSGVPVSSGPVSSGPVSGGPVGDTPGDGGLSGL